jgi:phosphatidylglycerophosphate synthase
MRIFRNLEEIESCRPQGLDLWTNICHKVSVRLVSVIQHTWITPNGLTLTSALLVILAAFFIVSADYALRLWGIVIMNAGYILDCADGQLARHKKIFSPFGPWLDSFTDRIKEVVLVAALTTNFLKMDERAYLFGLYLLFLMFLYHGQEIAKLPAMSDSEKKKVLPREGGFIKVLNRVRKKMQILPFYPGEQYFIISVFIVLDRIDIMFYVLTIYGSLALFGYPIYKYYHLKLLSDRSG